MILKMIGAFVFGAVVLPILIFMWPAMLDAASHTWGVGGKVAFWIAIFVGFGVAKLLQAMFGGSDD